MKSKILVKAKYLRIRGYIILAPYVPCKPSFQSRAAPHLALTNVRKKPSPLCYREVRVLPYVCRKQFSAFCWIFCPRPAARHRPCSRPQSFPSGAWSQKSQSSTCEGMSIARAQLRVTTLQILRCRCLLARHALFRSRARN